MKIYPPGRPTSLDTSQPARGAATDRQPEEQQQAASLPARRAAAGSEPAIQIADPDQLPHQQEVAGQGDGIQQTRRHGAGGGHGDVD